MRLLFVLAALACFGVPAFAQGASLTGSESTAEPKALYEAHCQKCHGPAGAPSAAMKRLLPELPALSPAFLANRSDSAIVAVLKNGKGKNMKPFGDRLTEAQMQALAKYIRNLAP
ncbi:MAG: cytochrome c [Gemmatimonadetes bacterium]|nr:cytochrome c [Gemmatimonadota bacterium]